MLTFIIPARPSDLEAVLHEIDRIRVGHPVVLEARTDYSLDARDPHAVVIKVAEWEA